MKKRWLGLSLVTVAVLATGATVAQAQPALDVLSLRRSARSRRWPVTSRLVGRPKSTR